MTPQIFSDTPNSNSKDKAITELEPSAHRSNDRSENLVLSNRVLEGVLDRLQKKDTYRVFSEPVDPKEVPDYYDFIKFPMDFGTMRKRITEGAYGSLEAFQKDIFLICSNAMSYNARDTVYYRQARSIQEAARKILDALKAGIPFEVDQKSQQSPVKKLSCKRPPTGKSRFELAGSDYTSGATLATCEHETWINDEVTKGAKVVQLDRSGVTAACNPERQAFNRWCIPGNANGLTGTPINGRLDCQDDLSGLSMKTIRDGKKLHPCDENHRNSLRPHNSLVCGVGPVCTLFGGERQQLIPMGYQQDYAYARSLARFAADLGPAIWKIAAEKIRKALPPGVPFGPGWVVDPPPVVFPVLAKAQAQSSSMLPSESKAPIKSLAGLQVGGFGSSNECMGDASTSKSQNSLITGCQLSLPSERLTQVPQLVSKSLLPSQQAPMKLSFRGANLASEVSQSKLLEMVSQNGRLVSWTSDKQMDQGATVSHSSGSVANHHLVERMVDVNVGRTTHDSVNFENNSKTSSDNSGLDFSTHAGGQTQSGWATQSASSRYPCMQSLNPGSERLNSGSERHQTLLMNSDSTASPSAVFPSVPDNAAAAIIGREDLRMPGWVCGQPADSSHWSTRLKFQNQLPGSALASQLLATAQYAAQYQEAQEYILQQREFQVRLAAAQQESKRMPTSVPQFRYHQFPCDVSAHAQQDLAQMHHYASVKQGAPLGSTLPCDSQDSNRVNLHSRFSPPIIAGSNSLSNHSRGFIPMQYPVQQASNFSHSLPPDLNVSIAAPKSSLDQASSHLSDSQQPDLALQL